MKQLKQVAKDGISLWLPIVGLTLGLLFYTAVFAATSFPMF